MKPDPDVVDGDAPNLAAPATAPRTTANSLYTMNLPPNLEQQIGAALDGAATTAEGLAQIIARCGEAIATSDAEAKSQEARIYDPALTPDGPLAAKEALESALICSGRLRTLLPRLIAKHSQV